MADLNIADVISNHRRGSHVVILQMPFEWEGKTVQAVEIGPFTLGHRRQWREGFYKSPNELMCAVCADPITHKIIDPIMLDQLRNPDDERIEFTFMSMLPHEMRESVINKQWPGSLSEAAKEVTKKVTRRKREPEPVEGDGEIDPETYEDEPMREDRGLDIG